MLQARLDENTTLTVSPLDDETYAEFVEEDTLGGCLGYFLLKSTRHGSDTRFEVLAKTPTFEAAHSLFQMIVGSSRRAMA
jgi:hypothetical protein